MLFHAFRQRAEICGNGFRRTLETVSTGVENAYDLTSECLQEFTRIKRADTVATVHRDSEMFFPDCVRVYGAQYFFLVYAERIIHQLLRPDAVFRHIV